MLKITVLFFSVAFLVSCAPRHEILGTTYGYNDASIEVLLDAQIDKLRVRHVRMNDETCVSGYAEHLEIVGEIGPDSTEAVRRLLPQLSKCIRKSDGIWVVNRVFLSSRGGYLSDGFAMGRLFREHSIQTVITGGQKCSSSCAIAFLGGKYRIMGSDGKLMFHAPYTSNGYRSAFGGLSIDCSDRGQVGDLANYYNSVLGDKVGKFLLNRTMSYCSSRDGWTLNADAAKLLGLLTP